jgi:hypothetical protein
MDRGVNGAAFLWKKAAQNRYIMIDIFNPDPVKQCYSVLVLPGNPYEHDGLKREIIGVGCGSGTERNWVTAYNRARKIAERYMKKN